jgi:hypothetical protein
LFEQIDTFEVIQPPNKQGYGDNDGQPDTAFLVKFKFLHNNLITFNVGFQPVTL